VQATDRCPALGSVSIRHGLPLAAPEAMRNRWWIKRYWATIAVCMAVTCLSIEQVQAAPVCRSAHREQTKTEAKPQGLIELIQSFAQGAISSLKNKDHREAFGLYRLLSFGDPTTSLPGNAIQILSDRMAEFPDLHKRPLQSIQVKLNSQKFDVTPELKQFVQSLSSAAIRSAQNFFQIEANKGTWKKILQIEDLKNFEPELRKFLTVEEQTFLAHPKQSTDQKILLAYRVLRKIHDQLSSDRKNTKFVSQAIVDLIHSSGFLVTPLQEGLKSIDGQTFSGAFQQALQKREELADHLGFKDHFPQVLKSFNIILPTGVTGKNFLKDYRKLLDQAMAVSKESVDSEEMTVRQLSLLEAPFRSCLGKDCSSRTYFDKAMDPNFQYFTLTDGKGFSDGHITLVLGTAQNGSQKIQAAFVDKIQNIPDPWLQPMIEAVRQSLSAEGYQLILPKDLGDSHSGLSNSELTANLVRRWIPVANEEVLDFQPHEHSYKFHNAYSRAYSSLPSQIILPGRQLGAEFHLKPPPQWKQLPPVQMSGLLAQVYDLKRGSIEDQIRYFHINTALWRTTVQDPDFYKVVDVWMKDKTNPAPYELKSEILKSDLTSESSSRHRRNVFIRAQEIFSEQDFERFRLSILSSKKFRLALDRTQILNQLKPTDPFRIKSEAYLEAYSGRREFGLDDVEVSEVQSLFLKTEIPEIQKSLLELPRIQTDDDRKTGRLDVLTWIETEAWQRKDWNLLATLAVVDPDMNPGIRRQVAKNKMDPRSSYSLEDRHAFLEKWITEAVGREITSSETHRIIDSAIRLERPDLLSRFFDNGSRKISPQDLVIFFFSLSEKTRDEKQLQPYLDILSAAVARSPNLLEKSDIYLPKVLASQNLYLLESLMKMNFFSDLSVPHWRNILTQAIETQSLFLAKAYFQIGKSGKGPYKLNGYEFKQAISRMMGLFDIAIREKDFDFFAMVHPKDGRSRESITEYSEFQAKNGQDASPQSVYYFIASKVDAKFYQQLQTLGLFENDWIRSRSVLQMALFYSNHSLVDHLLQDSKNLKEDFGRASPIFVAMDGRNYKDMQKLIELGFNVNRPVPSSPSEYKSLLDHALEIQDTEAIRILRAAGAKEDDDTGSSDD